MPPKPCNASLPKVMASPRIGATNRPGNSSRNWGTGKRGGRRTGSVFPAFLPDPFMALRNSPYLQSPCTFLLLLSSLSEPLRPRPHKSAAFDKPPWRSIVPMTGRERLRQKPVAARSFHRNLRHWGEALVSGRGRVSKMLTEGILLRPFLPASFLLSFRRSLA